MLNTKKTAFSSQTFCDDSDKNKFVNLKQLLTNTRRNQSASSTDTFVAFLKLYGEKNYKIVSVIVLFFRESVHLSLSSDEAIKLKYLNASNFSQLFF